MTWDALSRELEEAGLPQTLAGVAALRKCSEAQALAYLRSMPELAETAEVLADPEAMADIADAERERSVGKRGVPLAEVQAEIARRKA